MSAILSARLDQLLEDAAGKLSTAKKAAIVKRFVEGLYSKYFPCRWTRLCQGTGSRLWTLPPSVLRTLREVPPGQHIAYVESPVDQTSLELVSKWAVWPADDAAATQLHFGGDVPASGENFRLYLYGLHWDTLKAPPTNLSIALTGATNGFRWGYKVTAYDRHGETLLTAETADTMGPATLDASTYYTISFDPVPHALGYRVFRTDGEIGFPGDTALIATIVDADQALDSTGKISTTDTGQASTAHTTPDSESYGPEGTTDLTAPDGHVEGIALGCAWKGFEELAAVYSATKDARLNSGRVRLDGVASTYAARAKEAKDGFFETFGISPGSVPAAAFSVQMIPATSFGGTHLYEELYSR